MDVCRVDSRQAAQDGDSVHPDLEDLVTEGIYQCVDVLRLGQVAVKVLIQGIQHAKPYVCICSGVIHTLALQKTEHKLLSNQQCIFLHQKDSVIDIGSIIQPS